MQPGQGRQAPETDKVSGLEQDWSYKITVLADLVARRVSNVVQEVSGLNLSQWRVMTAIADRPGRTASEVVDVTPMDKAIVSRAVGTLVERGLLLRKASQTDGRSSLLQLTASGQSLYDQIVSEMRGSGADGYDVLSADENTTFLQQLDRVIATYQGDGTS